MPTKRSVTGLIATAMAAGAIIAGSWAVTTATSHPTAAATRTVAAAVASAPISSPATCYDM